MEYIWSLAFHVTFSSFFILFHIYAIHSPTLSFMQQWIHEYMDNSCLPLFDIR